MPCPHFNITITQRSKNQSAVAGAAYQSGETLFSEYDQKRKSYSEKRGIVYTEIMLPVNAPPEYADRNTLWNAAEKIEKQWNSQLARRIVLALVKNSNGQKMLIPAYRDMDPYDLPEEFSHLQAQDMSKLGFMQDLIRGIKKIIEADAPKQTVKETVVVNSESSSNIAPLLKRAFMFLEDGNFSEADEYCEKVLDKDPENAEAYLGKLMAELRVCKKEDLKDCGDPFDGSNNYQKACRFDSSLAEKLKNDIAYINDRNENTRLTGIYNNAVVAMNSAASEDKYKFAAEKFKSISGFKDADALAEQCLEKAEVYRKDAIYNNAVVAMNSAVSEDKYKFAAEKFKSISGWKDADALAEQCLEKAEICKQERLAKEEADRIEAERKAEERRIAAEKAAKKCKKAFAIGTPIVAVCIAFVIVLTTVIIPSIKSQHQQILLGKASVGDAVVFGTYEQDNDTSNGKEDIEWIVLAKENGKALVISKQALDCQQYNTSVTDVTWEKCTLRKWLNDTFLNEAFGSQYQEMILDTNVSADKNPKHSTNPGNATTDKVFLLSITEAETYFSSDSARQCKPTKYAIANGASVNSENGNCWWWLRSPGSSQNCAAYVYNDGSVCYSGHSVNHGYGAVRPALWINLG